MSAGAEMAAWLSGDAVVLLCGFVGFTATLSALLAATARWARKALGSF